MEKFESAGDNGRQETCGVVGHRIENDYYIVDVIWKDGVRTEKHFPVGGFEVVNPGSKTLLGRIKGKQALEILEEHAGECDSGDFSWQDFV
jgi:hypothetical protein